MPFCISWYFSVTNFDCKLGVIQPRVSGLEGNQYYYKKLQNYSPRRGTVIVEAFSLRKRNSGRYTTKQLQKKKFQKKKKKI